MKTIESYNDREESAERPGRPGAEAGFLTVADMPLSVSYLDTFWRATGVPLVLVPADPAERFFWLPPGPGGYCGSACHRLLWELGWRTHGSSGSSDGTEGGRPGACRPLELLTVPVLAAGRHVATLLGGPVATRRPRRAEFGSLARRLADLGIANGLAPSQAEFLGTPVFANGRLDAVRGLLGRIAQHIGEHSGPFATGAHQAEPEYVLAAKRFIHAHFTEDIDLRQVAVAVGVSSFHLCRVFHKATGSKFRTYLTSVRMDYAKKLLGESDLSIGRIAYASGFQSTCRFDIVFRRTAGCSPGRYRKKIRARASEAL